MNMFGLKISVLILAVALGIVSPALAASNYEVDPVHSAIMFKIKHADAGYIWGRFGTFTGSITVDEDNPEASSVEFSVDAASINTAVEDRDNHLRSPDFFGIEVHPEISFVSTGLSTNEDGSYALTGDLSLLGVTKSVTALLTQTGASEDPRRGSIVGYEAQFSIMRSDFGMDYGVPGIGDEVMVIINAQGILQ